MKNKYVDTILKFTEKDKTNLNNRGCMLANKNTAIGVTKRDCVGIHCSVCVFNKNVDLNLIETSKNE